MQPTDGTRIGYRDAAPPGDASLTSARRLLPEQLRWRCEPSELPFETTEEVEPLLGIIGQERAASALGFGLEIEAAGFNVFVAGPTGTGRTSTAQTFVERLARAWPVPQDWCYVYNSKNPASPTAIALPPGHATQFAEDMDELIEVARREMTRAFEAREYRTKRDEIHRLMQHQRDMLVQAASEMARQQGFAISMTPLGLVAVPLAGDRPMTAEEFGRLPEETQRMRSEEGERVLEVVREALDQARALEKEAHAQMADLDRQVVLSAIGPLIRERQAKYREHAKVVDYLGQVQEDIIANQAGFLSEADGGSAPAAEDEQQAPVVEALARLGHERRSDRYRVNVVVDNRALAGAPVVLEANPTYYNLLGRVEYHVRLGMLATDFRMIKVGAVHRANGGYLIVQALDLLTNPLAWDALKRTLRTGEIRIENMGEQFTAVPTTTLRPEPIPAHVKVVLIGPPELYYLLYFYDEEFRKLFKVKADFDVEMPRSAEHLVQYAAFISRQVRQQGLRHFHRLAVARVAEYSVQVSEHQEKLTTRLQLIADLLAEASHWAAAADSTHVLPEHVDRAIEQRTYRSNLIEEKIRELIGEGTIFIDTTGAQVGHVNGLSILDLGDYYFGRPVRVSAQSALGSEGVVNVEREVRLSGPLHSKAFLILTGFLAGRYAQERPLALSARITFEQTYDEVEGDSASSTELYALLSSLAGLSLRQDIAVTGSVNQHGEVQPVGGVTRKVEGFFDTCQAKGLTGQQGVIVPEANVRNLMLREDVVHAVAAGQFHVWAVRTIDEGMEILTGVPAGQRRPGGTWEPDTVNDRVARRLQQYAETLKSYARGVERGEVGERQPAEVGPRTPRLPRRAHRLRQNSHAG